MDNIKPPYRVVVWTVRATDRHRRTFRTSKELHTFNTLEERDAFTATPPTSGIVTAFGIDYETLHGKVYRTDRTARPAL